MATFKAIVVDKADAGQTVRLTDFDEKDLMDGDVTVHVEYSTVNYKDGLAVTGKAPVVRRFPMIAGVDFAGTVESPPRIQAGSRATRSSSTAGVSGETHLGAYAEKARVKGDWLVRLPPGMTTRDAMAIGTAGYTAMLSVMALERAGLDPPRGPIVVTGAAGGVGSVAIALLAKLGYAVVASTGRSAETAYLKGLGAAEVIERKELTGPAAPARQGALGRRHRCGGLDDARQCAVDDALRRRGRRLWTCRRNGLADFGCPVHSTRRLASRHRLGHVPVAAAAGGVAPPGDRSRPVQDRGDDERNRARRRHCGGPAHRRGAGARAHCGKNRVNGCEILLRFSSIMRGCYGKGTVKKSC